MYRVTDHSPKEWRFEDLEKGFTDEFTHLISQEDVDTFAKLTGDFNPLHLDPEYAGQTNYRKPVVFGMLSASFISTMIGMRLPGKGALWMSQSLQFLQPAFVGDTLRVRATVKQKSAATRTLVLQIEIFNQHQQKLIEGESSVKLLATPEKKERFMPANENRVAVVTGGSRGIGAAIAAQLAGEGYKVAVTYKNAEKEARELSAAWNAKGGTTRAIRTDVSLPDEVEGLFRSVEAELGAVTDLIHCAAPKAVPAPFLQTSWATFQDHLDTQVKGAYLCAQRALRNMIQNGGGNLLFIGSIFSDGLPPAQQTAYISAKAALSSLARGLAVEHGPQNVRVNTISPGMTQTEMIANISEKTKMLTKMQTPLRRLAEAADIAKAASFLLSPAAGHITGETLRVCGGLVMV
jgi:3-oxoacyl-[acyl-carrier protein] reductase